mgnify:FL=1
MNKYSATSVSRLRTCHEQLQILFHEVLKEDDHTIICGHRNQEEQDKVYPEFSSVQWPDSKHNRFPSEAVDAGPYTKISGLDWSDSGAFYIFVGKVIAKHRELVKAGIISFDLRCGADWNGNGSTKDQNFNDLPHFEGSNFRATEVDHEMWIY